MSETPFLVAVFTTFFVTFATLARLGDSDQAGTSVLAYYQHVVCTSKLIANIYKMSLQWQKQPK